MMSRNIKYYRVRKGLTEAELARVLGLPSKQVQRYETGEEIPDLKTARHIASELGIRLADLMAESSSGHKYEHGEYRKHSRFSQSGQEYVKLSVEDYLDRFFAVTELIGGKVLRDAPEIHSLKVSGDAEIDGLMLMRKLGFSDKGAIPNLVSVLEDNGILIIPLEYENDKFSGMNGFVDGRPYVVLNSHMTGERQRSTLVHELGHIYFERPCDNVGDWEHYMTAVSVAFLSSADNECGQIEVGKCLLFEQLVARCVSEGKMSVSRGAELLRVPYAEMQFKLIQKNQRERVPLAIKY